MRLAPMRRRSDDGLLAVRRVEASSFDGDGETDRRERLLERRQESLLHHEERSSTVAPAELLGLRDVLPKIRAEGDDEGGVVRGEPVQG